MSHAMHEETTKIKAVNDLVNASFYWGVNTTKQKEKSAARATKHLLSLVLGRAPSKEELELAMIEVWPDHRPESSGRFDEG